MSSADQEGVAVSAAQAETHGGGGEAALLGSKPGDAATENPEDPFEVGDSETAQPKLEADSPIGAAPLRPLAEGAEEAGDDQDHELPAGTDAADTEALRPNPLFAVFNREQLVVIAIITLVLSVTMAGAAWLVPSSVDSKLEQGMFALLFSTTFAISMFCFYPVAVPVRTSILGEAFRLVGPIAIYAFSLKAVFSLSPLEPWVIYFSFDGGNAPPAAEARLKFKGVAPKYHMLGSRGSLEGIVIDPTERSSTITFSIVYEPYQSGELMLSSALAGTTVPVPWKRMEVNP